MKSISIVYFSSTGNTHHMAEAVAQGAGSVPETAVSLHRIAGKQIIDGRFKDETVLRQLDTADAIIFGSPTFMGDVAGEMKCFLDSAGSRWFSRAWVDKLAAGFTVSAGLSGDKFHTLVTFSVFAAQCGMIWISHNSVDYGPSGTNRLGSSLGAMGQAAQTPPEPADISAGHALGQRVASLARRFTSAGSP
jgi:NAD(P)H dehydrogenase (quinone)